MVELKHSLTKGYNTLKIAGIQKLTLLDFPSKVASILFTAGCNFRCPFCHNGLFLLENGQKNAIPEAEIFAFLEKRKGMLEGVVITGGEPLLHPDIDSLLISIKALGYLVKLDTNGSHPKALARLIEKKLVDYVAMDIKHTKEGYPEATGLDAPPMDEILQTKEILEKGTVPHEFRTTLVKGIHTREDILKIAEWISPSSPYFLQNYKFTEGVLAPEGLAPFSDEEMKGFLTLVQALHPNAKLRGII